MDTTRDNFEEALPQILEDLEGCGKWGREGRGGCSAVHTRDPPLMTRLATHDPPSPNTQDFMAFDLEMTGIGLTDPAFRTNYGDTPQVRPLVWLGWLGWLGWLA